MSFVRLSAFAAALVLLAASAAHAQCFGTQYGEDPRWDLDAGVYAPPAGASWIRNAVTFTDVHGATVTRWYWRYVSSVAPVSGRRLVVALHGGGSSFLPGAEADLAGWGWNAVAEARGWVVVYPEGTFDPAELSCASGLVSRGWNDGRYFAPGQDVIHAHGQDVDDVGFVAELIDTHVATHAVDHDRVYVFGASNGGLMANRLAADPRTYGRFAAVATNLATLPAASADPADPAHVPLGPKPAMHLFGELDQTIPAAGGAVLAQPTRVATIGGCSDGAPEDCTIGVVVDDYPGRGFGTSRATMIARWEIANGVTDYAVDAFPDIDADGLQMGRGRASNPGRLADLELLQMEGGGHRGWGQSTTGALGPACLARPDCGSSVQIKTTFATSTFDVCWVELVADFFAAH